MLTTLSMPAQRRNIHESAFPWHSFSFGSILQVLEEEINVMDEYLYELSVLSINLSAKSSHVAILLAYHIVRQPESETSFSLIVLQECQNTHRSIRKERLQIKKFWKHFFRKSFYSLPGVLFVHKTYELHARFYSLIDQSPVLLISSRNGFEMLQFDEHFVDPASNSWHLLVSYNWPSSSKPHLSTVWNSVQFIPLEGDLNGDGKLIWVEHVLEEDSGSAPQQVGNAIVRQAELEVYNRAEKFTAVLSIPSSAMRAESDANSRTIHLLSCKEGFWLLTRISHKGILSLNYYSLCTGRTSSIDISEHFGAFLCSSFESAKSSSSSSSLFILSGYRVERIERSEPVGLCRSSWKVEDEEHRAKMASLDPRETKLVHCCEEYIIFSIRSSACSEMLFCTCIFSGKDSVEVEWTAVKPAKEKSSSPVGYSQSVEEKRVASRSLLQEIHQERCAVAWDRLRVYCARPPRVDSLTLLRLSQVGSSSNRSPYPTE